MIQQSFHSFHAKHASRFIMNKTPTFVKLHKSPKLSQNYHPKPNISKYQNLKTKPIERSRLTLPQIRSPKGEDDKTQRAPKPEIFRLK